MTAKTNPILIDDAINYIFVDGMTLKDAAIKIGVNPYLVSKLIRARGLVIPYPIRAGHEIKQLPDDLIISQYQSGISELELSKRFNIDRGTIRRRLIKNGVKIRNQSEANIVSMSTMTFEQRQNRTKSANNALRGSKQSIEGRIKRSIGIENTCGYENMIGIGEKEFAELLTERGINFTRQKSVNIYSIDFAIGNVAVELKSGSIGGHRKDKFSGRIKNLRESGYISLYICAKSIDALVLNIDYIISNINRLNINPSSIGEYWVIRCRIDNFARRRNELGQFACIPSAPKLFTSCRKFNY